MKTNSRRPAAFTKPKAYSPHIPLANRQIDIIRATKTEYYETFEIQNSKNIQSYNEQPREKDM